MTFWMFEAGDVPSRTRYPQQILLMFQVLAHIQETFGAERKTQRRGFLRPLKCHVRRYKRAISPFMRLSKPYEEQGHPVKDPGR